MKFIIGKNIEEKKALESQKFSFFKEEDGEFWFIFKDNVNFSESSNFEVRDRVNI